MRLAVVLLLHMLYAIALHGTRPIIALEASSLGASVFVIGTLVSAFAFFPMILAVTAGKQLDQYGAKVITIIGGFGFFIALIIPYIFTNLAALFFSQVVIGLSHLYVVISLQKTIGNLDGNLDKLMVALTMMASVGELLGPLISGFSYQYYGFKVSIGISAFLAFLAFIMSFLFKNKVWDNDVQSKKKAMDNSKSSWKLLRQRNLRNALIISGLVLYSKDLFVAYFPIYAGNLGIDTGTIGIILSIMAAMGIIVRLSQYRLVKSFGRDRVLLASLFISGISYMLVPFNEEIFIIGVLAGLIGLGLGLGQPLSVIYCLNLSPKDQQGQVLGMRITFNRGSQFMAPILFGGVGGAVGLLPIFVVSGSILAVASMITKFNSTN